MTRKESIQNPEKIAKVVEQVMTNLTAVHDDVVTSIAKSDMTIAGIIASINNNVYPIGFTNFAYIKVTLENIGLK